MKTNYDVIVVGGGVAGVSAALSARREHRSVLLIEKLPILGGLATSGLINWFEPLCDGKGNQLIFSICEELFELSLKYGYSTFDKDWKEKHLRMVSFFDHNLFALSLNKLLLDEGIDISYESLVSDVKVKEDKIDSIEITTTDGKRWLKATEYIDASGNACLFRKAGLEVYEGQNYLVYCTTTLKDGVGRPTFQYTGAFPDGNGHPQGEKFFNGIDQDEVNEFIQKGQLRCLEDYENKKIKDLSTIPSMPQFRKIAAICGEYCLTKKDLNVHHKDSIGTYGVFYKPGEVYEIPMGCLYSQKIQNLFAAGRIISSQDDGWETIRVIPVCILTGEVAGLMASLSLDNKLFIKELQNKLLARGNKLHFD